MDERQTGDRKIVIWALEEDMPMVNAAAEAYAAAKGEETAQTPIEPRGFETYEELESESIRAYYNGAEADLMLVPDRIAYNSAINGRARTFDREELDINRKYMPHRLSALTVDGQICGIPATSRPVALYYNKSLTVQAGLEISADEITIDELYETAQTIKENLDIPMFALTDDLTRILYYSAECALNDIGDSTVEEKTETVLGLLKNFSEAGYLYAEPNMTWDTIIEKLIAGEIVGVIGGPEWKGIIDRAYENCETTDEWGIARLPKNETFGKDVGLEGMCWVMPLKADGIAATYEFVTEYADCYEALQSMADNTRHIPAANDASGVSAPTGGAFGDTDAFAILCEIGADAAELETYCEYKAQVDEFIKYTVQNAALYGGDIQTALDEMSYKLPEYIMQGYYEDWTPSEPPQIITVNEIYIKQLPNKRDYFVGESLDPAGLIIKAIYSNGEIIDHKASQVKITEPSLDSVGEKTVRVSLYGKSAEFTVTVAERRLLRMRLIAPPTKTVYIEDENFELDGIELEARFEGDVVRRLNSNDVKASVTAVKAGTKSVTVSYSYNGVTVMAAVGIEVYARSVLTPCLLASPFKKIYLEGEQFDPAGMKVGLGFSEIIGTATDNYEYRKPDGTSAADYRPTLTCADPTVELMVTQDNGSAAAVNVDVNVLPVGSKIGKYKRDKLDYACDAGSAAVVPNTGEFVFEHYDGGIGANMHRLEVSHIFSVGGFGIAKNTGMGANFKLDVQQYLTKHNNKYEYIDRSGMTHIFEPLETDGVGYGKYYDTSGLDFILSVTASGNVIKDRNGNAMFFTDGVLTRVRSCHNAEHNRYYNYEGDKLVSVTEGVQSSYKIEFEYSDGLLKNTVFKSGTTVVRTLTYGYDENSRLTSISEQTATAPQRTTTAFKYDTDGYMTDALDSVSRSLMRIEYSKDVAHRVSAVKTGVASYTTDGYEIATKYSASFQYRIFAAYGRLTHTIVNNNGIKTVYNFNYNGITTAVFELKDGNEKNYLTLNKDRGVSMFDISTPTVETVNGKNVNNIADARNNILLNMMLALNDAFGRVRDYRRKKCPNYVYYSVGLWLKLSKASDENAEVSVRFLGGLTNYLFGGEQIIGAARARIDNSAVGVWQYVKIPVKLVDDNIGAYGIYFHGIDECSVADIRLEYSPSSAIEIESDDSVLPLAIDKAKRIGYTSADGKSSRVRTVGRDWYMTEKDLQATFLDTDEKGEGILSLCDMTKKIHIKSVQLYKFDSGDKSVPILRGKDGVCFTHRMFSPDNNTYTQSSLILGSTYNGAPCIVQRTKTRSISEGKSSQTETYVDLKGKILKTTDEYGVNTLYEYDDYGNVKRKTVCCDGVSEQIVYEAETTGDRISESDKFTTEKSLFGSSGNITQSLYSGKEELYPNILTTSYGYDGYDDKLISVGNNAGYGKVMTYDSRGRLHSEKPAYNGETAKYGYEYEYSDLDDGEKTYEVNTETGTRRLLTETSVNRSTYTLFGSVYRSSKADETITRQNKYGKALSVREKTAGETDYTETTFTWQNLDSSGSAAQITAMHDGYEGTDSYYRYDDRGNCTAYGNDKFGVRKTDEKTDKYDIAGCSFKVAINMDSKVLNSPRIASIKNYDGKTFGTYYSYDSLGRVSLKRKESGSGFTIDVHERYVPGTAKSANTLYKSLNTRSWETEELFKFEREYNARGLLSSVKETVGDKTKQTSYVYDIADRLTQMTDNGVTTAYTYGSDGSLASENFDNNAITRNYITENGRLKTLETIMNIPTVHGKFESHYDYDNLGNCTHYASTTQNLYWERGSLLKRNAAVNAEYSYNSAGARFRKKVGDKTTEYYLDGDKILAERTDLRMIKYLYDAEGIAGFAVYKLKETDEGYKTKTGSKRYLYVKDACGNVKYILDGNEIVASYSYDPWGKCTALINTNGIGTLNPIRWKSLYYDTESGFYYINGRYYSPEIKRYISPSNGGYTLGLTNPINAMYNGSTAETETALTYDPPALNWWKRFELDWNRFWAGSGGYAIALITLIAATVLCICCPSFLPYYIGAIVDIGLTMLIGGTISGVQNVESGGGFWDGFGSYVHDNLALTATLTLVTAMVTFGISQAVATTESVKPAQAELAEYELDPRSIELAKEGDPSFSTFRKRVWQNEAKFRPERYDDLNRMRQGLAPYRNGSKLQLHHVKGRALDNYDVVALTQKQHIQFHKKYKYHINDQWNMANIRAMFGGKQ